MWTMEDIPFSEQPYTDTGSLAIADLSPKRDEECFNFPPRDGTLGGMTVEGSVSKHIVYGTIERYRCQVRFFRPNVRRSSVACRRP